MTDTRPVVLKAEHLGITFGGLKAVSDFNMEIHEGELMGLIGPNGAGKTTVFNLLTGVYVPTEGAFYLCGQKLNGKQTYQVVEAGIARTFQNIRLFKAMTVLDNVKIEIAQASEMCNIYTDILEGITDAFSNVLNNNLNTTMRILTGITIILAMPTIIFSFYGMNVAGLPLAELWWYPVLIAVILCVIVFLVLKYTRILK